MSDGMAKLESRNIVGIGQLRDMFNDNMGRLWSRGSHSRHRGGMAGGVSGFVGVDGGIDRVGFGN